MQWAAPVPLHDFFFCPLRLSQGKIGRDRDEGIQSGIEFLDPSRQSRVNSSGEILRRRRASPSSRMVFNANLTFHGILSENAAAACAVSL